MLHRVPASLDPVLATMFNPLGAGVRWGVTVPGPQPGGVVAVLGPAVRGLAALVATKEAGAAFVAVTGFVSATIRGSNSRGASAPTSPSTWRPTIRRAR